MNVLPATIFAYSLGSVLAFILGNAVRKGRTPASLFISLGYPLDPLMSMFILFIVIGGLF